MDALLKELPMHQSLARMFTSVGQDGFWRSLVDCLRLLVPLDNALVTLMQAGRVPSLLADFEPKGAVARQYGAYESQLGVCKRALFVIDKEGVVAWSYISPMAINPGADGILDALDALANSPQSTPTKN